MTTNNPKTIPGRINMFEEYVTRELQIIWEHSFQNVPPTSGDGITDKFFKYNNVTRSQADVQVNEGGYIRTRESGDYGAGQPVIAGMAGHFNSEPTGDQDGWLGYVNDRNGAGFGWDTDGMYVFYEYEGTREKVYKENWNVDSLEREGFDPTDGFILRIDHACYGHAEINIDIGIKKENKFMMRRCHKFTELGNTMWENFDHPIEWNFSGTQGDGNYLAATACHYEGSAGRTVKRQTGETWTPQKNSGNNITLNTYPNWTYLMGLEKRPDWEEVEITPIQMSINSTNNIEIQLTSRGDFSNTSFGRADDTSTTETGINFDLATYDLANDTEKTNDTTINSVGEREWIDVVVGDKQQPVNIQGDISNIALGQDDTLALLARPATSNSTDIRFAGMRVGEGF